MDIQTMVDNAVKAERADRMQTSPQMTLGELILTFEPIAAKQAARIEEGHDEANVYFDFGSALPTGFSSWRGAYAELAINYSFNGYGGMVGYTKSAGSTFEPKPMTVTQFLEAAKACIGKTFEGWKGGDFVMGKLTPLWVANDGDSDNTAVISVADEGYTVRLNTAHCDY